MYFNQKGVTGSITVLIGLFVWSRMALPVFAGGATRELPDYYTPEETFTVWIAIDTPDGTTVVALEDSPPAGWTDIGNISDGGSYDSQSHKVKYLFGYPFPQVVTYEITPPTDATGQQCFAGTVSFDGVNYVRYRG